MPLPRVLGRIFSCGSSRRQVGKFSQRLQEPLISSSNSFLLEALTQGAFVGFSMVRTDVTKESISEMIKEFRDIGGPRPVTTDELKKAQDNLTLSLPGQYESLSEIASMISDIVTFDLPENYYNEFPNKVKNASTRSLTELAKERVLADQLVLVVVGDRQSIESGIQELNLGPIEYLDADGKSIQVAQKTQR